MAPPSQASSTPPRPTAPRCERAARSLVWGKKNAAALPLDRFVAVRKGKATERTRRCAAPTGQLLSLLNLLTDIRGHESLDAEAPTTLDRDKFASAFAQFLGVPLAEEGAAGGRDGRAAVNDGASGECRAVWKVSWPWQ